VTDAISSALLPADVRADGAHGRQLYAAALGFEQALVRTLAAQLAETATTETDEGGDAAAGLIRDQIPDALAHGISANGGLGLAHELYLSMKASSGVGSTEPLKSGDAGSAGVGAGPA
jgi:Rod binding domain-containing protein